MKKIPILFLKDDESLIQMYKKYFEVRGYCSIVVRGGGEGLEQALLSGPSLVTLDTYKMTDGENAQAPIIIFTYQSKTELNNRPRIRSAIFSSDVFSEIESSLGNSCI